VKHAKPAATSSGTRRTRRRFSPRGLYKRLSLQGRFALLAAVAVSVAVVVAALASYFLVRAQLYAEVDNNLSHTPNFIVDHGNGGPSGSGNPEGSNNGNGSSGQPPLSHHSVANQIQQAYNSCQSNNPPPGFGNNITVIVTPSGTACANSAAGTDRQWQPNATELAVANGTQNYVFYDAYLNGEHFRVYTSQPPGATGYAVSLYQSLATVESSLHSLELWLAVAAAVGIGLATGAGMLVARSATRPVRRLTAAVEHVARTEDLSVRLPVDGKDEINRLGASFNKMTKALATSRDRQRQLIADAGHELRTPLTSLRTNVDLLLRSQRTGRELPPGRRETMLESVDQQLHELSGLVTDLLELSRGQEGGARRTMRMALHESVGRAVERAKLRGPGLIFDVDIEPWYVQGDPTSVDRAVVNLLDNAVKFSPPGGTVTVRLKQGEYTVTDQGPGIAAKDLPHVFERFWRSDSARSLPGSGLGLAIVAQVAEESGGAVSLEPAPTGGALARLRLPGDPGSAPPPAADRRPAP
jgi:two-component system sensor histidine kinase MprB